LIFQTYFAYTTQNVFGPIKNAEYRCMYIVLAHGNLLRTISRNDGYTS
jgi:hypothetical protein